MSARAKRVRAGHRSTATKWIGEVDALVAAAEGGTLPDRIRVAQLKRGLEDQVGNLDKLNTDILDLLGEEEAVEDEIASCEEFELGIVGKLKELGKVDVTPPDPTPSLPPTPTPARNNKAKLPKFTLQRFNGEPTQWYSFWELYDAAVHSNTEVEKFTYLKSHLEKSAHEAITGLTLTGENYKEAIEILESISSSF